MERRGGGAFWHLWRYAGCGCFGSRDLYFAEYSFRECLCCMYEVLRLRRSQEAKSRQHGAEQRAR